MTVKDYALILRDPALKFYDDGWYTSRRIQKQGYRATYSLGQKWYWYSVSETTAKVPPHEVANAISLGRVDRAEPYKKSGFEATVRYEGHSYMVNEGDTKPEG